jgi:hypothetical protein
MISSNKLDVRMARRPAGEEVITRATALGLDGDGDDVEMAREGGGEEEDDDGAVGR